MLRILKIALGLILILSMTNQDARAQWGYGGWGWGGWGSSLQSSALHGAGYYAMGAGIYNYDTALANNINGQTAIMMNNAWAQAQREDNMIHHMRVVQDAARDRTLYNQRMQDMRDKPGRREIENGDALNLAVQDLSDPRLGSSALRAATASVPAALIADVPFQNASERVTFMLNELRAAAKWPKAFDEPRFASDKKLFDDIVARIRKEDVEGDVSPKTLREAKQLIKNLNAKLAAEPLQDEDDQAAVTKFLNACTAMVGLLEKPDVRAALAQLRNVKDTSLGNLLGFMHAFNLRFGAATTLKERQAYQQLFAILKPTRDQILSEAKLDASPTAQANAGSIRDIYGSFDERKAARPNPEPPPARNPQ
jgi:hypothetical protein